MPASEESIALLRSIDGTLKALFALSQQRRAGAPAGSAGGAEVASDADLDSQHGDPVIKAKDPRDWNGPSMKGRRFSECPAEYLDLLAGRYDFFARNEDENKEVDSQGRPKSKYSRRDAARARGWAARIRAGKVAKPPAAAGVEPGWVSGTAEKVGGAGEDGWASEDGGGW